MTPTRRQKTENRREHIIHAALGCFIAHGFHQTSMRDIADAAGVSLGNLYNHFAGKQELIAEIAAIESSEKQPLIETLATCETLLDIRVFCRAYLQLCQRPEDISLSAEVLAEAARHPELAARFAENRRQLAAALAAALTRGAARDEVDSTLPFAACADWLLDAIEGLAINRALLGGQTADSELDRLIEKLLSP